MTITFVFIFYVLTNVVPANIDQFQLEARSSTNTKEKLTLTFTRQKNEEWKVVPSSSEDDVLLFRFDKDNIFYMHEVKRKKKDTLSVLQETNIKRNHKKWAKTTKISFGPQSKDGNSSKPEEVVFSITREGKKKRIIAADSSSSILGNDFPTFHVSWK